jgi:hypothetical protein
MNIRSRIVSLAAALSVLLVPVIPAASVYAAPAAPPPSPGSGNGLKISPVRTDVTINPGTTQVVDVFVQNVTGLPATLQGVVNDFVADGNETGTPKLILDANDFAPSHSLKRLVAPISNFNIASGGSQDVKVKITVPANAAGGGYYGAVRFAPASADTTKNLALSASVGSLILVKVPGNITEQLVIKSFDVRKKSNDGVASSFYTSPKGLESVVRFQDTGNIQLEPFGKLTLKKGSKVLQQVEINNTTPPGNVLPDSVRRFNVALDKLGSFGKYTVEGDFGYGSSGQLLTAKTTFYVVPVAIIIVIILIILLILAAIFGLPKLIRGYNRRVIQGSGGNKRGTQSQSKKKPTSKATSPSRRR